MKATDIPAKFPIPFANNAGGGFIWDIPQASQIGVTDGRASLFDGFVPLNFQPVGAGGVPPFGKDFNGLLRLSTSWNRWQSSGGPVGYDAAFQSSIGGYPQGAVIMNAPRNNLWLSLVDDNLTNPDSNGAGWILLFHTRLTANLDLYISPSGSDSTGFGTITQPWRTIEKAWTSAFSNYDFNGFGVIIHAADGNYTAAFLTGVPSVGSAPFNYVTSGGFGCSVKLLGNIGTPGNVTINGGVSNCINVSQAGLLLEGCTISNTNVSAGCLVAQNGGILQIGQGVVFGPSSGAHIQVGPNGAIVCEKDYTISGGTNNHWFSLGGGTILMRNNTITLSGTPTFSSFCSLNFLASCLLASTGFSGSAIGSRYVVGGNSVLNLSGATLPGNAAGSTVTGGQVVA